MVAASYSAGGGIALLILVIIGIGIYFIPTIVASTRKVTNVGSVFVINFLLGWTLVGWAVALAMAVKTNLNQTQVVIQSGMPACTDCGQTLQPGMKFCAGCGASRNAS
jgi:hypothetical protein